MFFEIVVKNTSIKINLIIYWDYFMEDYVNRRNYLHHLKQISAIKNGHGKSAIKISKSRIVSLNKSNLAL